MADFQDLDAFIDPTELYSVLPPVYDHEIVCSPALSSFEADLQAAGQWLHHGIGARNEVEWQRDSSTSQQSTPLTRTISLASSHEYNVASSPDSPSQTASTPTAQPAQSQKRRAQNRAAQRAYRDRKMRYLVDLQAGIREIEAKIRHLQSENTGLIRQLSEMRAANNDLRDASFKHLKDRHDSSSSPASPSSSSTPDESELGADGPEEAWSRANFSNPVGGDLDALYEPFAAMWNLIHLDPSVVRGTVSAKTVLERLRAMVQLTTSPDGSSNVRAPAARQPWRASVQVA